MLHHSSRRISFISLFSVAFQGRIPVLILALILVVTISFSHSSLAGGNEPVKVLVWDSPVELSHSKIAPFVDVDSMLALRVSDSVGREISWFQQNSNALAYGLMQMNALDEFETLPEMGNSDSSRSCPRSYDNKHAQKKSMGKVLFERVFRRFQNVQQRLSVQELSHGTSVASIIVSPWQSHLTSGRIQLLAFPLPEIPLHVEDAKLRSPESIERNLSKVYRLRIQEVSRGIEEAGIQVVNMSWVFPSSKLRAIAMCHSLTLHQLWIMTEDLDSIARSHFDEEIKAFQELVQKHSNVIFVMGAGNNGENLDEPTYEMTQNGPVQTDSMPPEIRNLRAENVVIVGAMGEGSRLAHFSTYGANTVNVAAPGTRRKCVRLRSMRPHHSSGTSFSAPLVTRELALLRYENPELSASEVIQKFYLEKTQPNPTLEGKIQDGRELKLTEFDAFHAFNPELNAQDF